jgi:hypothetical protein
MYSFRPEPEPEEREALVLALEQLLGDEAPRPSAYGSPWRRAALEEDVSGEGEDESGR